MQLFTARQAWHDAFDLGLSGLTYAPGERVGKRDKAHDMMLKGMIQSVIQKIQKVDLVAYSWGMYTYAPLDGVFKTSLNPLHAWLDQELLKAYPKINRDREAMKKIELLKFVAMRDASYEDLARKRKRRRFEHLGRLIGVEAEEYKNKWHKYYILFRVSCLDLPARCLPPVARFVTVWNEREEAGIATDAWSKEIRKMVGHK